MNKWWSLCFMVFPLVAWPQTDDITYKGVPLGASIAEYKEKLPDQDCSEATNSCRYSQSLNCIDKFYKSGGEVACFKRNSFGGSILKGAIATFREGKLVEVLFVTHVNSFDNLTGAAKERLGEPTKVIDRAIQTRAGATLQNREMIWERPRMVLTVQRYGSTIDSGIAVLTTSQERDRKLAEYETRKKKGAQDF